MRERADRDQAGLQEHARLPASHACTVTARTVQAVSTGTDPDGRLPSASALPDGLTLVTPTDAIADARLVLGGAHWKSRCPRCQVERDAVSAPVFSDGDPAERLAQAVEASLLAVHAADDDFDLHTCDYDLRVARTDLLLASAGVPGILAWGPGHAPGPHPDHWRSCPICTQWVTERRWARARLSEFGLQANDLLGDDDDPQWPDALSPAQ
jgi:hypothetical protein